MNLLEFALSVLLEVFRQTVLDSLLQLVLCVLTCVANLHLRALANLVALLYEFLTALLSRLRDAEADNLAVVLRSDTYIAVHDCLLDVADLLLVERTDSDSTRIGHCNVSHLIQWHHRAP